MFRGCYTAVVTPMRADGSLDQDAYEALLNWQIESGVDGLVILGTTGESPTVTPDERVTLVERAVAIANKRVPVIVGTGTNATATSIRLTQQAADLGADAALVVCPYYNKPTQEGLYQHHMAVADAVDLPQILYNIPGRTSVDMQNDCLIRLAKHERIVGVKDAVGELSRLAGLVVLPAFSVLSGDDANILTFAQHGGHGVVSVAANIVPDKMTQLCHAALAGDDSAALLYETLSPLFQATFAETNPIPTKYMLQQMGRIPNGIRLPLTWFSDDKHAAVKQVLQDLSLL